AYRGEYVAFNRGDNASDETRVILEKPDARGNVVIDAGNISVVRRHDYGMKSLQETTALVDDPAHIRLHENRSESATIDQNDWILGSRHGNNYAPGQDVTGIVVVDGRVLEYQR